MNLRDRGLVIAALFFGAAWGASHGCTVGGSGSPAAAAGEDAEAEAPTETGENPGCTCTCAPKGPEQLKDFGALMEALEAGRTVRAVFYYGKCELSGAAGPDAIGGMEVGTYEYFAPGVVGNAKAYLATSENKLIHMQSGKVYNYVKARLEDGGSVTITAQYLDPTTFAVKMDEKFACEIDDGSKTAGVRLFAQ
jgi:hypothetical protein